MEVNSPVGFYAERLHKLQSKTKKISQKIGLFSWLRLVSFLLMAGMFYLFTASTDTIYLIASGMFFILLVGLIVSHQKLYTQREHFLLLSEINQNENDVLSGGTSIFDTGKAYISQLPFADDLDLFGEFSLFHYVNRCTTGYGKDLFAESLLHTPTEINRIQNLQMAIRQMSEKTDFNQEVMVALLGVYRRKDFKEFVISDEEPMWFFKQYYYKIAAYVLPLLVIASFIYYLTSGNISLFLLNGSVAFLTAFAQAKKMALLSEEMSGFSHAFHAYYKVLEKFESQDVSGEILTEMKKVAAEAKNGFKQLAKISEWFDRRANILWYALGNLFFMHDLHLAFGYEKWKYKYHSKIEDWLITTGRLEMLISYGVFRFNHPDFVTPTLSSDPELFASDLGHPLIPSSKRVSNTVHLQIDPRLVLVTGSNMSGKSTWLRTLGVNVLLAQAGAPVCANAFRWKPMPVLSSLRQSDSLHENTSLFMNELKQLKAILDRAASAEPCLILLDEVLRGTNSEDKYTGSYALIHRLTQYNSLIVMASHDLKLSLLEKQLNGKVVNHCFESKIENGQLLFDYTIRKGIAANRNATWLMQDMGIIKKDDTSV